MILCICRNINEAQARLMTHKQFKKGVRCGACIVPYCEMKSQDMARELEEELKDD